MKKIQSNERLLGIASGMGAYLLWGILPIYWKLLSSVQPMEVLAHRIIWSFIFLAAVLTVTGKLFAFIKELRQVAAAPSRFVKVVLASLVISVNWLTYIWAVNNDHVIETSLGYYINPLISVLLGIIVLKERLSLWQTVSFLIAMIGVLNMTIHFGAIPWAALLLAFSFGLYGLLKKMVSLGAITGITIETLLISPFALLYIGYMQKSGSGAFGVISPETTGFMIGAGVITAVPLILFAGGANRLPLSIVGFLQYISPTITLILGVFLYHEPFTRVHLSSFIMIWTSLTIFSLSRTRLFIGLEDLLKRKVFRAGEAK
ncbi:MAG: transporter [Peptococcaceae bacterium BICA1-7]|nr:MAG: transporter [Peptococcaceae bacterium BICA1-7]HBV97452.1 EamA family transporter RarD [Desulfotomaculum sp.]